MPGIGHNLENIVNSADGLKQIGKSDVRFGDLVIVTTVNSVYYLYALANGEFLVTGGWFERNGSTSGKTSVNGCTWGGSVIKHDIIAACGLHLEFGNRVVTSPIKHVRHIRNNNSN